MDGISMCLEAENYSQDAWVLTVHLVLILFSFVFFGLALAIFRKRSYRNVAIHPNLKLNVTYPKLTDLHETENRKGLQTKILLANIFVLFTLVAITVAVAFIRIQIHYIVHDHPCDLLVPTWMSVAVRAPMYLYVAAFPLFHLAVTVERLLATMKADRYETSSSTYGIVASLVVWFLSISYISWIVLLAFGDKDFRHPAQYYVLTVKTNSNAFITAHWFFLALDVLTCIVDIMLIFANRRHVGRVTPAYSLSRSYQVVENVRVTVHLIVPLDVCNTILFVLYLTPSTVTRYFQTTLSRPHFSAIANGSYSLLLLQSIISLAVFIRFCKRSKQTPKMVVTGAQPDLYFKLFNRQIA